MEDDYPKQFHLRIYMNININNYNGSNNNYSPYLARASEDSLVELTVQHLRFGEEESNNTTAIY